MVAPVVGVDGEVSAVVLGLVVGSVAGVVPVTEVDDVCVSVTGVVDPSEVDDGVVVSVVVVSAAVVVPESPVASDPVDGSVDGLVVVVLATGVLDA